MRRIFDTNVFGLMDVTTAALPYLRKSKDGRMVVIGSRSAWRPEIPVSKISNSQCISEVNSINSYQIVGNRSGHILLTLQLFLTKCLTHPGHYASSKAAVHGMLFPTLDVKRQPPDIV